jgi:hypothetical protein
MRDTRRGNLLGCVPTAGPPLASSPKAQGRFSGVHSARHQRVHLGGRQGPDSSCRKMREAGHVLTGLRESMHGHADRKGRARCGHAHPGSVSGGVGHCMGGTVSYS